MAQEDNEEASAYVLRVEAARKKRGVDKETTFHSFTHRLPLEVRVKLETARGAKAVISGADFGWGDVVAWANSEQLGGSLVKPGEVTCTPATPANA